MKIILTTLNARYTHSSLALRYLYANLNEFKNQTQIEEYTINDNIHEIVEKMLISSPDIIGIGVYIWNALEIFELINVIKLVSPETIIILGGPEVSYSPMRVDFSIADYIIQGEGEIALYELINSISKSKPLDKGIIQGTAPQLDSLELPYKYYTENDIKNRVIYVEASRGCPFTCEFCLSSIDHKVRDFDINKLLTEFEMLWNKGARNFKFIDRTFNININKSVQILDYFLGKDDDFLVHFEVIPEFFPDKIKDKIKLFKPGRLQLEIGIQTLNTEIATKINRKMDFNKIKDNIKFLEQQTNAHLHVDLIIGLPGESVESFGNNLNILGSLTNSEIQLGILKKLSGTTINRHDEIYNMIYTKFPPYEILQNDLISYLELQELKRFTRYWDLFYNSGNFKNTIKLLWPDGNIYKEFRLFSIWLYNQSQSTYQISLNRLSEYVFDYLYSVLNYNKTFLSDIIIKDLTCVPGRKLPTFLKEYATYIPKFKVSNKEEIGKRQLRHID